MIFFSFMNQLLVVDPITAYLSAFVENIESSQFQNPQAYSQSDKGDFQRALGINCWKIGIQEGQNNEHFCIHYIECKKPNEFVTSYRNKVRGQNRFAAWLHQLLQTHLSLEYSLIHPLVKIHKVLDLAINPGDASPGYDFFYMLPLLPHKVEDHKEYCRLAMNEKSEETIASCKAFGMIDLKKRIQESPFQSYVLYFQKMAHPIEHSRQVFLSVKNNTQALQATQTLRDQTGLLFENLCPKVTSLSLFHSYKLI